MSATAMKEQATDAVTVTVSDDGYSASLTFTGAGGSVPFSKDELLSLLAAREVAFGIHHEVLNTLSLREPPSGSVIVADGRKPVDGKDGWIEYTFNPHSPSIPSDKDKKINYHNLGWIHNVLKDEVVAFIHQPDPGIPGVDVHGAVVPPADGKGARVKLGNGVMHDRSDAGRIIATVDGNASLDGGGTLHVEPVIRVHGNVDYSTGDIDFVGAVVISGDVKSDFSVKAKKSIEVQGNVEDALLVAGGNVVVKKGFIGQGKGSIAAGGDVEIQHVLNQSIHSEHSITIQREAICAKLHATEKITSPSAVFVGCVLEAGNEVEVFNLGNGDRTQAKVRVGKRLILLEQYTNVDKESVKAQKQLGEVKNAIYRLVREQLDTGKLSSEQEQLLTKLRSAQVELGRTAEKLQKEKELLRAQMQETNLARIVVHDTMFANVMVELNGIRKLILGAVKEVVLTENSGKIEEKPLE